MVIAASAMIFVACGVVFFSLAFWLGRVETVANQLWELLITFSLYPDRCSVGRCGWCCSPCLPAGFVGYVPVRILHAPSLTNVAILVCVAIGYVDVAVWLFDRGLRRYASGSRFSTFG